MTKKIQCRVIDSTALSTDEQMHLGWSFDTRIYKPGNSPEGKYSIRPIVTNNSRPKNIGNNLDCYA
jgi:hypothetical protein